MQRANSGQMDALDAALVACLIRFARRGRMLRKKYHGDIGSGCDPVVGDKEEKAAGIRALEGGAR